VGSGPGQGPMASSTHLIMCHQSGEFPVVEYVKRQ